MIETARPLLVLCSEHLQRYAGLRQLSAPLWKSHLNTKHIIQKRHHKPNALIVSACFTYEKDPTCFDFALGPDAPHFLRTAEYQTHPLVLLCAGTDTLVIPLSIYGDGVQVTEAPLEDSIYVRLHREAAAQRTQL